MSHLVLMIVLGAYGAWRLVKTLRSGVYQDAVIQVDRGTQPSTYWADAIGLALGIALCCYYVATTFVRSGSLGFAMRFG